MGLCLGKRTFQNSDSVSPLHDPDSCQGGLRCTPGQPLIVSGGCCHFVLGCAWVWVWSQQLIDQVILLLASELLRFLSFAKDWLVDWRGWEMTVVRAWGDTVKCRWVGRMPTRVSVQAWHFCKEKERVRCRDPLLLSGAFCFICGLQTEVWLGCKTQTRRRARKELASVPWSWCYSLL